ncbi:MAG TPA: RluA family pseudouridine synthase [Oligoflexia bacterium]|nr:RluA family pseudouridine synthase [Oligoflexia bacterium]HMR23882.1 RluA family pseudouridine synthase [Oligoflexia bacterium]
MNELDQNNYTVLESQNGQRLDHFLNTIYLDVSRSYLQKELIQAGNVLVNDKPVVKKSFVLFAGDQIKILSFVHPESRKIEANTTLKVSSLYSDENFVVYNKPKKLATHPNRYDDKTTLANYFIAEYPNAINVGENALRPGVVHRLDTDTSGCIIFAKTQEAYTHFRTLFNERKVYKLYLAVVIGKTPQKGLIDSDLAHHQKNTRKMVNVLNEDSFYRGQKKNAVTAYHVLAQNNDYSLLLVKTFTGRMHQIRVHLSGLGYPLIGDKIYQKRQDQYKDVAGEKQHCLHAYLLGFNSPKFNKKIFQAEIPEYFRNILLKTKLTYKTINSQLLFLSIQEFLDSLPFVDQDV